MRARGLALATLVIVAGSCVSTSLREDVGRVRQLTGIEQVASSSTDDPATSKEVQALLSQPLDIDTAVRVAILNNRELRATLAEMGIARGRWIQAGVLPNPVVEAERLPERDTKLELRVEYDLTRAILAPMRARAMRPALEAARYRAAAEVVELGYRARCAFYRLLSAETKLAIARQVLEAHAAANDAARAMFDAGNTPELEVASRELEYEKARVRTGNMELEAAIERERMQGLLGASGADTNWRVQGVFATVPEAPTIPQDVETLAVRASLDLRETKEQLESLARSEGVTRTEGWLPDVTVDVHSLQGRPDGTTGADDWRFGAGASITLPLFDRRQGASVALGAEFGALLERYYGKAIDLRSAARVAQNRVTAAHARARHYQEVIVPLQKRVTEQTLLHYNAMQLGIFALLQAHRDELDAKLAHVEALADYFCAVAELDALLAGRRVTTEKGVAAERQPDANDRGGH